MELSGTWITFPDFKSVTLAMAKYIYLRQIVLTLCAVTERIAILGASRGIGAAIAQQLQNSADLLLMSRKWNSDPVPRVQKISTDFTHEPDQQKAFTLLKEFSPHRIFYVAGGGPHGNFAKKEFKDHLWAYKLNLLFPAQLIHWALDQKNSDIHQIVIFGSAIAENQPDPQASSYSSAKHGIFGLVRSLVGEALPIDLRIYSPGYTATDLLPEPAQNKLKGRLLDPHDVARDFLAWAKTPNAEFHRIYHSPGHEKHAKYTV